MIPVFSPHFGNEEKNNLLNCIEQNMISSAGSFVSQFEEKFAQFIGSPFGITVSSGSAALETACHALGLGPGDEVLVPDQTIISCPLAVKRVGSIPVFVDVDPENWNIDISKIENKITAQTRAIMVVHLFGLPVNMADIQKLAKKYNLKIIEDCAQAIGSKIGNQYVGTFGDVAAFSFFANKAITMGEGGFVLTSQKEIYERAKNFKNLYFGTGVNKFEHEEAGWNYRITNIQAAVGMAQLSRIHWILERKKHIAGQYRELLKDEKRVQLPIDIPGTTHSHWMCALVVKSKTNIEIIHDLKEREIDTRPFFYSLHKQKMFCSQIDHKQEEYPNSDYLSMHGLYLPSGLNLDFSTQQFIVNSLRECL